MRAAFTLLILCVSVLYTYVAFVDLNFLSSTGRLGPGFFPRIIGLGLIFACLLDLTMVLKRRDEPPLDWEHGGTLMFLAVTTLLFVLAMDLIGGYFAMIAFMLATLMVLNRGRWMQNIAMSLLLPLAIYLIFDFWLNAAVPRGIILGWLA